MVRQVDCVTVKGSNKPVGLYTYDVDVDGLDNLRLSQQKTVSAVEWAEEPCGREGGVLLKELLTAAAGPPPARCVSTRGASLSACHFAVQLPRLPSNSSGSVSSDAAAGAAAAAEGGAASPPTVTSVADRGRHETFSSRHYEDEFAGG
jgi:hypothetical protein